MTNGIKLVVVYFVYDLCLSFSRLCPFCSALWIWLQLSLILDYDHLPVPSTTLLLFPFWIVALADLCIFRVPSGSELCLVIDYDFELCFYQ